MNTTPIINFQRIADAQVYYATCGFTEVAVPWIIQTDAYHATRPPKVQDFYTLGGYLNASGEQSFIEMMLNGASLGRQMCVTACFREEPASDGWHHRYFMKLELIDTDASEQALQSMLTDAQVFFNGFFDSGGGTSIVRTEEGAHTYDIVDTRMGIELGSYGIRSFREYAWVYGTGVALPRLDSVLTQLNRHV